MRSILWFRWYASFSLQDKANILMIYLSDLWGRKWSNPDGGNHKGCLTIIVSSCSCQFSLSILTPSQAPDRMKSSVSALCLSSFTFSIFLDILGALFHFMAYFRPVMQALDSLSWAIQYTYLGILSQVDSRQCIYLCGQLYSLRFLIKSLPHYLAHRIFGPQGKITVHKNIHGEAIS